MIEITKGTLEARIIKLLQKTYPVTISEVSEQLGVSYGKVKRCLMKLRTQGIVRLEPLPGKTFIRLLRNDFRFIGRKAEQRKFIKRSRGKRRQPPKDDYDDMMYA